MTRIQFIHTYEDIISPENLLLAWKEFRKGKRKKEDVGDFEISLNDNIFSLHSLLKEKVYEHSGYYAFNISDPKPRNIHKATVRDRLFHHVLYRTLSPFFDRTFISDSYSCRFGKGTHKAIKKFIIFGRKVSKNNTKTCWVLKCDIRKFFASIDHPILLNILSLYIPDKNILWLLNQVISSFKTESKKTPTPISAMAEIGVSPKGLPLGNLTSQLFVNIYMNEFDQFVKHKLKIKYYVRYADDFVILSQDKNILEQLIPQIVDFLDTKLKLTLHPDKVLIKTLASGVDFLGWVHFPHYRVLRTATKKRMMKRIAENEKTEIVESYLGMLSHGNASKLKENIEIML